MKFYKQYGKRVINYEYYDIAELDIGTIPYESINRALRHEIFLRHPKTNHSWQFDFKNNIHSSVLVKFPEYISSLYEFCLNGHRYQHFFSTYNAEILDSFEYLFPSVVKRLDRLYKSGTRLNKDVFEEINYKKLK
jgi:hypothetical protein